MCLSDTLHSSLSEDLIQASGWKQVDLNVCALYPTQGPDSAVAMPRDFLGFKWV